jgi:hypothetical protein
MTDIAQQPATERIARVLAGHALSPNGDGPQGSERAVSDQVDAVWRDELDRALAVLKTLREPTKMMVAAGEAEAMDGDAAEVWSAMVRAAIDEHVRAMQPAL